MTADYVIETDGLTKRFSQQILAVDDVDLRVRRGEVYGFVGPNGAGKTTTMRMLVGLIRPSAGTASVLGHTPRSGPALAEVGAMIESPDFYPFLSARDNLRVMAGHAGVASDRIEIVLDQVDLLSRAHDGFDTYSSGMKQRLGLAAALLKDPDVLILDEPTGGLDPEGIVEMRERIRSLGQGRRTVMLSSHIMHEVEQICDRIGIIHEGRLVAEGNVDELRGEPVLRIRANPQERAREILADLEHIDGMESRDGILELTTDPDSAGDINRHLVNAGIEVRELTPIRHSLEEIFLELTHAEGELTRG